MARFNAEFSDEAHRQLKELARRRNKTMTDVVKEAIALEMWWAQAKEEGAKVLKEMPDGRLYELVRP